MFGISSSELFIIIIVASIVLGPKELVRLAKTLGTVFGKINAKAIQIQREINLALARDEPEETFNPNQVAKLRIEQKLSKLSNKTDES